MTRCHVGLSTKVQRRANRPAVISSSGASLRHVLVIEWLFHIVCMSFSPGSFSNHTAYPSFQGQRLNGDELWALVDGLDANKLLQT